MRIPKGQIEWLVGRHCVTASTLTIARDIWPRTKGWPRRSRRAALRVALRRHAENQNLYLSVTTGRF
jgi:hypothetical protein